MFENMFRILETSRKSYAWTLKGTMFYLFFRVECATHAHQIWGEGNNFKVLRPLAPRRIIWSPVCSSLYLFNDADNLFIAIWKLLDVIQVQENVSRSRMTALSRAAKMLCWWEEGRSFLDIFARSVVPFRDSIEYRIIFEEVKDNLDLTYKCIMDWKWLQKTSRSVLSSLIKLFLS